MYGNVSEFVSQFIAPDFQDLCQILMGYTFHKSNTHTAQIVSETFCAVCDIECIEVWCPVNDFFHEILTIFLKF